MKRKQWVFNVAGVGVTAIAAFAAVGTNWRPMEFLQGAQEARAGKHGMVAAARKTQSAGSAKVVPAKFSATGERSELRARNAAKIQAPNVAVLERQLRQQWAEMHPSEAHKPAPAGSYREVAHLVQPYNWKGLRPVHRAMVRRLMLQARQGVAGVAPCFAPGTDLRVVKAFEGIANSLQFYRSNTYWSTTAAGAHTEGTPVTIRWSVVDDGTPISSGAGEAAAPSNLKARLNSLYGSEATWRPLLRQIFARWAEFSGVRYVEEAADDGAPINGTTANPGQAGVRGDVRIGGHTIDGNFGILAYNYFPDVGDMVIDTGDSVFNDLSSNSRIFRNVLAHEHGHGLGFSHVCPLSETKLMEPILATTFDGPQIDDIQNAQRGYGDALEENDTQSNGTDLGTLADGTSTQNVRSIDSATDVDYYRFSIAGSKNLTASLRPLGGSYLNGSQNFDGSCSAGEMFDAGAQMDLQLDVLDNSGSVVAHLNAAVSGATETLPATYLSDAAGPYVVRIYANDADAVQLYNLDLTLAPATAKADFVLGDAPVVTDSAANGNNNGRPDPGESSVALTIPLRNIGSVNATNVSGTLVSLTSGVTVVQATADYPDINAGADADNTTQPTISINSGFSCGSPIKLRLDVQSDQASDSVEVALVTGTPGAPVTFAYTSPAVTIPDPGTVEVPLVVTGSGIISDINVGLESVTHTWVGDLVITLVAPSGKQQVLVDRLNYGDDSENNFTNTVLDDEASGSIQTAGHYDGSAPFTGSFKPANPLSVFDGEDANGTWKLRIRDFISQDSGAINGFSLRISAAECGAVITPNQAPVNLFNGSATFPDLGAAQTVDEGGELVFDASHANRLSVTDPDAGIGAVRTTITATNGTLAIGSSPVGLTITGNGSAAIVLNGTLTNINTALDGLRYIPATGYTGPATLTILSDDLGHTGTGGAASDTDIVPITVAFIDDAPIAHDQSVGTNEDQAVGIILTASDSDSPSLVYAVVNGPSHGTLAGTVPNLIYTPATNFNGVDSFTFRANDGNSNSNLATVSVFVGGANDAPVAVNDFATTPEDTPLDLNVAVNDTDVDGDLLRVVRTATTGQAHGAVSINANGTLHYVPDTNFFGTATFTYTVSDGTLESTASVTVTVGGVNDAPVAQNDAYTVTDGSLTVDAPGVLANDSDIEGDALRADIATTPANGFLTLNEDGSFTYTPKSGFSGTDVFYYQANDGAAKALGVVTLTVQSFTPPPPPDKLAPNVLFASPVNGVRLARFPAITGVARDNADGSGVRKVLVFVKRSDGKYWNGRSWGAQTALEAALTGNPTQRIFRISAALPTGTNLSTGVYYVSAVALDGADNRGQKTVSFRIIDLTAPQIVISTPRHGATLAALTEVRGTLSDEALGSGPSLVWLFIRRSSDGQYWTGRVWSRSLATLRTTLTGSGSTLNWARTTELPPAPASESDVYFVTAVGYDRSGNRRTATIAINVAAQTVARSAATGRLSSVALSNVAARAATGSVTLVFNGALDAGALEEAGRYAVSIGERLVPVESVTSDAAAGTVVLGLSEGAFNTGDKLTVAWNGLHDTHGAVVQGSAQVTAR